MNQKTSISFNQWKIGLILMFSAANAQIELRKMNIDESKLSVSGHSSGAAMATQLHFAHSSKFLGAGMFSGVPYMCGNNYSTRMCTTSPALVDVDGLIIEADSLAVAGKIDSTSNIRGSKVFIFHGSKDARVLPGSGTNIKKMYEHYGANIHTEFGIPSGHWQPIEMYGAVCESTIETCGYHGAFEMLNYIHGGNLTRPDSSTKATGDFELFYQSEFFDNNAILASMDTAGFVYIPTACKNGALCALHAAFHGCGQYRSNFGDIFATGTGYREVAELNNIIILFPQTVNTSKNPYGCWDWWGYTNDMFGKLNIDESKLSVSGFSADAAMATQLHFAYSSKLLGAGMFSGIPYMCGNNYLTGLCTALPALVDVDGLVAEADSLAAAGKIDSTANIRGSKVFIYHGSKDAGILPGSGTNIKKMYEHYGAQIHTEFGIPSGHWQPTEKYFVNSTGEFHLFDQSEFFSNNAIQSSLDTAGFVYIPTACKNGELCALHVAFHGCKPHRAVFGSNFATEAGYREVAELNNIIIIFPQTVNTGEKSFGCWDCVGYTNEMF
ncbi:Poly(3-hydroxyalkanoate) depolymerase C [Orchesella cincta]|uniref:Poly(3-hydroxyalkanoate) depolymerase C n=1 Tax=Orchesella cincta TaxID=48709 RepID=A0A1D2MQU1_ORCCI|nr:Poly(3-hydroxyalkanoate) depolymerase C [Orchesella cincta]